MQTDKLSVAIIGAGNIAGGYDENKLTNDGGVYTHARAFTDNPHFELACVYDSNYEKALQFKKCWNVLCCAHSIKEIFTAYHDVVSVCTPDNTHYDIIRNLLLNRSCKTIYAEKPLASDARSIAEIISLSRDSGIHVVVNFQRRFDSLYSQLCQAAKRMDKRPLTINGIYMKGLEHSGVAMIDAITSICGYPEGILAFNRTYNQEISEYSYDFILYYDSFNATVKSIDSVINGYTYHIFEIDLLFSDRRIVVNDNSRQCEIKEITDYAYSGVRVLNDANSIKTETDYKTAIGKATEYIYKIIRGDTPHKISTPELSYNNALIIDGIIHSYEQGKSIRMDKSVWR